MCNMLLENRFVLAFKDMRLNAELENKMAATLADTRISFTYLPKRGDGG